MTLKSGLGTKTVDELGALVGAVGSGVDGSVRGDTAAGSVGRVGGADAGGTVCDVGTVPALVARVFEKKRRMRRGGIRAGRLSPFCAPAQTG